MKTITVEVTAQDIARGLRQHCQLCPIALALIRCAPNVSRVDVDWVSACLMLADSEDGLHATLPMSARRFVKRFDNAEPVAPLTFQLNFR